MKPFIYPLLLPLLACILLVQSASAQSDYELQFANDEVAGASFCVDLQIRAAAGEPSFVPGSHTFYINFNKSALEFASYTPELFYNVDYENNPGGTLDGGDGWVCENPSNFFYAPFDSSQWSASEVQSVGEWNVTSTLNAYVGSGTNCDFVTDAAWITVGRVCFTVEDNSQTSQLAWYVPLTKVNQLIEDPDVPHNLVSSTPLDVPLTPAVSGATVSLKVFLEGPYVNGSNAMGNTLFNNPNQVIPLAANNAAVYGSAPWSYAGSESVANYAAFPTNFVDWVLVEARTSATKGSDVETKAGLLLTNGNVVATDGISPLTFGTLTPGSSYFFVVRHRSHLDIMTSSAVNMPTGSTAVYDFTTGAGQGYGGNPMKVSGDGNSLMYAGDFDANGTNNNLDFNIWNADNSAFDGYFDYDADMNAVVNNLDFNQWNANSSNFVDVEIQP